MYCAPELYLNLIIQLSASDGIFGLDLSADRYGNRKNGSNGKCTGVWKTGPEYDNGLETFNLA